MDYLIIYNNSVAPAGVYLSCEELAEGLSLHTSVGKSTVWDVMFKSSMRLNTTSKGVNNIWVSLVDVPPIIKKLRTLLRKGTQQAFDQVTKPILQLCEDLQNFELRRCDYIAATINNVEIGGTV